MASHLSMIGFSVETAEDFEALAMKAANEGELLEAEGGYYVRWERGRVQLWAQATRQRELCGCNPHFAGESRLRVSVGRAVHSAEQPLDGSLHGWVNPPPEGGDEGDYPILVDMPDFWLEIADAMGRAVSTVQVTCFARELAVFADEPAFHAAQEKGKPGYAAESFVPVGLFTQGEQPPEATALLHGVVLTAERATNPETGRQFHWLTVRTLGGVYDVVADLETPDAEPISGNIVRATGWLSGRIVGS